MRLADAFSLAAGPVLLAAVVLAVMEIFKPSPALGHWCNALFVVGEWLMFIACVMDNEPLLAATWGIFAAVMTWLWWRNRPKGRRRKATRELGAKSRARIEAMVRQMTPSPIPSPAGGAA